MLKLSYSHTENNFAIPYEKYVVKTKTSPDLKIMTYLGNGEFKRDLFGFDVFIEWLEESHIVVGDAHSGFGFYLSDSLGGSFWKPNDTQRPPV